MPARASGFKSPPRHSTDLTPTDGGLFHDREEERVRKLFSLRSWPSDIGVGVIFLASVGLITVVMITMVVLFSRGILV